MPSYDFTTLSPIDFEILVRDLLQREFGFTLESFKPGKDQGIDLRRFIGPRDVLIVQCKHYAVSGLKALLRDLEDLEAPKVKKLKPKRYVLATSVALSPANKEAIRKIFAPYCRSAGDVYGRDDLNNLLGKNPEIEKQHLKLWITSTAVLESIVHSQLFNTSREELEKIQRRSKVYVYNQSFSEALDILNARNFCIIAGIPGIGKTTLAEMLVLYFLAHDFELIRVSSNIREASSVSGNSRRVFYYDDFLGQSSDADKFEKNEDQRLLDFIETIRHSKVSKLILTTREYILNQARMRYEKLARTSFELETCIVDLAKYTRMNRAEILFNHVYFSDLPPSFKKILLADRGYLKIIDHPNYNPRFVDILTQLNSVIGLAEGEYVEFFLRNLTNPHQLWSHAFTHQLTASAREVLVALTSLPREVFLDNLRTAFGSFSSLRHHEYSAPIDPNGFMTGCKELDGNFVSYSRYEAGVSAKFHNPSVRDFLQGYCQEQPAEMLLLMKGAAFFEQLIWLASYVTVDGTLAFASLIADNIELFVDRLRATIGGPSCTTKNEFDHRAGNWVLIKSVVSFEAHVEQLVALRNELNSPPVDAFLEECLGIVSDRAAAGDSKQGEVVSLVESFDDLPDKFPGESRVAVAAKELLRAGTRDLEDFELINRFRIKRPDIFDEQEMRDVRAQFKSIYQRDVDHWLGGNESQSPDDIRECAELVEQVGDWLGLDTSDQVSALQDYAQQQEEESTWDAPDDDDYRGAGQDEATDRDIESLFRTLPLG